MAVDTKQEQSIREVVNRFETLLSEFINNKNERRDEIDQVYFNHAISKAVLRYIKNYVESYTAIQVMGTQRSTSLTSIYITQKLQAYTSIRSFESVDDLEEAFTRDLQRSSSCKGHNLLGLNIANEEEYLMVLGLPASGKTTYLKHIGSEALRYPKGRYKHDVVPVFLQPHKFYRDTDTLLQAIAEEFEKCGFPTPQELALWMLEQGKLIILIDGLNESALSHNQLSHLIKEFVTAYPRNRYIVSSRLDSYENSFGQFLEVELQPWGDLHVQEYIHRWFTLNQAFKNESSHDEANNNASAMAQRCWEILQVNTIARELAKSPLSLSLLCLLCDRRYSLPSNVSGLYQKSIQLLIEEQLLNQQLDNIEDCSSLSVVVLELILAEIAYRGFEICKLTLPLEVVTVYIEDMLTNYFQDLQELSTDFVFKILKKIGICKIINSESGASFSFTHINFQEYFVALYIHKHNQTKNLVVNHLHDRHWQNVFLFLAGMMSGNVEELLIDIEFQAAQYINASKLTNLLIWLEKVAVNSSGDLKNISKRIATLFLARPRFLTELAPALSLTRMLFLARNLYGMFDSPLNFDKIFEAELSLSLAQALDFDSSTELDLAMQLCSNLEQSLIKIDYDPSQINFRALSEKLNELHTQAPSYDQPFDVRLQFRNQISRTWLQTLYLPLDSNQLSYQEITNLENYLYANLLMVRCKNEAIAISRKTWQEIESRMLRITN
ncbi:MULTISPECIES: NACHT domain-containing protein [Pseudanabaena]|jgi:hypothetical protein|uniref:NACHT domain-containing protein n=1 Tax=Pseudanabaena TaxID=1152 RepID=UPI00247A2FFD|nr:MULTISPECIES: NACHT domain-containing protein [Pseudanabaena]MEA5487327.1 NACHT domain-containing protein [Pseudanabaena sp. CCNP1317]WGS70542.1 NACHT domain-containing protein [Pseudanabaena galeata CCNP1313]